LLLFNIQKYEYFFWNISSENSWQWYAVRVTGGVGGQGIVS